MAYEYIPAILSFLASAPGLKEGIGEAVQNTIKSITGDSFARGVRAVQQLISGPIPISNTVFFLGFTVVVVHGTVLGIYFWRRPCPHPTEAPAQAPTTALQTHQAQDEIQAAPHDRQQQPPQTVNFQINVHAGGQMGFHNASTTGANHTTRPLPRRTAADIYDKRRLGRILESVEAEADADSYGDPGPDSVWLNQFKKRFRLSQSPAYQEELARHNVTREQAEAVRMRTRQRTP